MSEADNASVIEVLRKLDQEIDFARGSLQLSIVLELGKSSEGLTVKELSTRLNERSKAIADALRKMMLKDLVIKTRNGGSYEVYILSDKGRRFYNDLQRLTKGNGSSRCIENAKGFNINPHELSIELMKKDYIVDAIIAIATSKKGILSLKDIAEAMGLSRQRAQTYLDMYSSRESPIKLFKKIDAELMKLNKKENTSLVSKLPIIKVWRRTENQLYRLTEDGIATFHRLSFYTKYKNSRTARILQKIFGVFHPRLVAKKLFRLITAIDIVVTTASLIISLNHPVIALMLLLSSMIFTVGMLIIYIVAYNL